MLREIFQICDRSGLYAIALRLVWRLLDACFAFSSCRPPQTVHSLSMAQAKTPSLTNRSQHRETCRKWNVAWAQIWLCHRADLPWLEAAAHQTERFKFV
jgi:hypothetical protein